MMRGRLTLAVIACLLGSVPATAPAVVVGGAAASIGAKKPFAITVDTSRPYVQAQVLVTLRLTRRIGHYPAAWFLVPRAPDISQSVAIVKPLKYRTTRNVITRNGRRYLVTKWRYAVFPQMSGGMAMGPVALNARVATDDGYTRFDTFHTARIRLHVRSIPTQFTGNVWLPAKSVHVYQGFNPGQSRLALGSPISRRLAMTFSGAQSGELPAFTGSSTPNLDVHPFRPRRSEHSTLTGLAATLEQQISLTPTQEGQLRVPSLEVPWWNTVTDQEEVARFPGYTLTVTPAPSGWNAGRAGRTHPSSSTVEHPRAKSSSLPLFAWIVVALVVVASGAGLLGLAIIRSRRKDSSERLGFWFRWRLKRRVLKACAADDAMNAAHALLCLAQSMDFAGRKRSLRQLANAVDEPLQSELLTLNAALYGAGQQAWRGRPLVRALHRPMQFGAKREGSAVQTGLPCLHPLANGKQADVGCES